MAENFLNLKKQSDIQIQEAQRIPNKMNLNSTSRHIIIKMGKVKDKKSFLKAEREKQRVTYKEIPIRLSVDFSAETMKTRKEWHDIVKVLKETSKQTNKHKNLKFGYSTQQDYHLREEINNFSNKQKLKEFSNNKTILKEMSMD